MNQIKRRKTIVCDEAKQRSDDKKIVKLINFRKANTSTLELVFILPIIFIINFTAKQTLDKTFTYSFHDYQ